MLGVALEGRKMMRRLLIPLEALAIGGIGLGIGTFILGRRGSLVGLSTDVPGVLTIRTPCLTLPVALERTIMSAVGVTFMWVSFIPVMIFAKSMVCLERPVISSAVRVRLGALAYCLGSKAAA